MKNFKLVLLLSIILTTIISCSKKDDDFTPSFENLIVENSPWKFNGVELTNVINNSNEDFDKTKFEIKIRETNDNVVYIFKADGTGEILDNNEIENTINWEILDDNKLKLSTTNNDWESVFSSLNVTEAQLNFILVNMQVAKNVNADVKYLLNKPIN